MQVKILRLLQEMSFERLGSNQTIQVDVRVLCATNRDLERAMAQGAFREDLYHRLNVVTIAVPPLRERREDIPSLVEYFLNRYSGELGVPKPPLADEALESLKNYAWPGNVRELEHLLQRVLIFTRGYTIQAADLPATLRTTTEPSGGEVGGTDDQPWLNLIRQYLKSYGGTRAYEQVLEKVERLLLAEALQRAKGNKAHAARLLGLPRPTLHAKLQRYGLLNTDAEPLPRWQPRPVHTTNAVQRPFSDGLSTGGRCSVLRRDAAERLRALLSLANPGLTAGAARQRPFGTPPAE